MKGFRMKGTAMVLLCISIAVSGLDTVRAEGMAAGNTPGTEYPRENNTVSGGDAADSGSGAIGIDGSTVGTSAKNAGSSADGIGTGDTDSSIAGTDAGNAEDSGAGTGAGDADGSTAGEGEGDTESEKVGAGGKQKGSGTVSGGDGVVVEDPVGTDGSGDRQGDEGADAGAGSDADAAEPGGKPEKDVGESGDGGGETISPYGLAVYPDGRLMQWDMGNSSRYVEDSDANAVFDGLYGLYSLEATADFIVTVPAVATLTEDAENGRVIGMIPVTVEYLRPVGDLSLHIEEGSLAMQDKLSGKTLALEHWWEDLPWEGEGSGISSNLWLKGERLAGDWEGTVRLTFTCEEDFMAGRYMKAGQNFLFP